MNYDPGRGNRRSATNFALATFAPPPTVILSQNNTLFSFQNWPENLRKAPSFAKIPVSLDTLNYHRRFQPNLQSLRASGGIKKREARREKHENASALGSDASLIAIFTSPSYSVR